MFEKGGNRIIDLKNGAHLEGPSIGVFLIFLNGGPIGGGSCDGGGGTGGRVSTGFYEIYDWNLAPNA